MPARRPVPASLALLAIGSAALSASPAPPPKPEHDVTAQDVVYRVPGMADVSLRADVPYKKADGADLKLDLYLPPASRPAPAARRRLRQRRRGPARIAPQGLGDLPLLGPPDRRLRLRRGDLRFARGRSGALRHPGPLRVSPIGRRPARRRRRPPRGLGLLRQRDRRAPVPDGRGPRRRARGRRLLRHRRAVADPDGPAGLLRPRGPDRQAIERGHRPALGARRRGRRSLDDGQRPELAPRFRRARRDGGEPPDRARDARVLPRSLHPAGGARPPFRRAESALALVRPRVRRGGGRLRRIREGAPGRRRRVDAPRAFAGARAVAGRRGEPRERARARRKLSGRPATTPPADTPFSARRTRRSTGWTARSARAPATGG